MARPITKKQDIESAAIRLFADKGIVATTLKHIAREAGATEGALYRHYKSKDDMAWQLFTRELGGFSALLAAELAENGSYADRLERGVRFVYRYFQDKPDVCSFILLTQHSFPDEKLLDENTNPHDMTARFIAEGMEQGAVAPGDPILASALVMGMILQPLVMQRYGRLQLTNAMVDSIVAGCLRVLQVSA